MQCGTEAYYYEEGGFAFIFNNYYVCKYSFWASSYEQLGRRRYKSSLSYWIYTGEYLWEIPRGENIGHISVFGIDNDPYYGGVQLRFTMIASHMLNDYLLDELCGKMVTYNYDLQRISDNADFANEHMKIIINGEPVNIRDVRLGRGSNHYDYYFLLETDIVQEKIENIYVECK